MQEHIDSLKTEIHDTLTQLRYNIGYLGADDNRTLYNKLRNSVHPHYCSVAIPPCLICKVDNLVDEWLTAQGQHFATGGKQTDYREEWSTAY